MTDEELEARLARFARESDARVNTQLDAYAHQIQGALDDHEARAEAREKVRAAWGMGPCHRAQLAAQILGGVCNGHATQNEVANAVRTADAIIAAVEKKP
jgi:hypothetical protein